MPTAGLDVIMESVLMTGDLKELTPAQRLEYYKWTCESVGLNPLSRPFDYVLLNGKLVLYPKSQAADQIRNKARISVQILREEIQDDMCRVTVRGTTPDGRTDEAVGIVALNGAKGQTRADLVMKAHTKAHRRLTLSMVGLGYAVDYDDAPLRHVTVSYQTGEVFEPIGAQNTERPAVTAADAGTQEPSSPAPPSAPGKPPHPLQAAGYPNSFILALTQWVGKNIKGAWPADRAQSAQELSAALIICARHGIEPDYLMRLCEGHWHRTHWSVATAEQLVAEIRSLDAGEPPPDAADAHTDLSDDLPETLPW